MRNSAKLPRLLLAAITASGFSVAAPAPVIQLEITTPHQILAGKPVEVELDLTPLARGRAVEPSKVVASLRGSRRLLPLQFDPGATDARGTLVVLLPSDVAAGSRQVIEVRYDARAQAQKPLVRVSDEVEHQGQASARIETEVGTYVYHLDGAGFASLFDRDGKDWISYRPGNGSAGEYRGIPNLGLYAHPGYTGEKGGTTRIESRGPIRARLRSESRSGEYSLVWDFFPRYARMTIVKAGQPYWFLYEGTPGGALDVDGDFVVTSTGVRRPVSEAWHGDLPEPEWVYFGDARQKRSLFVVNHQQDSANDQFWQMQGNMTVFGFGREYRCCGRYMSAAPAQFTIGLAEASDYETMQRLIESAWRPVSVRVLGGK